MSITQIYSANEFFDVTKPSDFKLGQFCWVPIPHIDHIPRILDIERSKPEEHEETKFELRLANQKDDFKKRDRTLPIKHLNLRSNEELLCQRAKKRPAIILTNEVDCFPDVFQILKQQGKKHQQQECMFVVPCYSTQIEEYSTGIIQPIVARTKCLIYRQFFYIPPSRNFHEMIAKFDKVHPVTDKSPSAIEPTDLCLSEEVFHLFLSMFIFCVSGKSNDKLEAVKQLAREAYPEG